jgi:hypothetical protein
MIFSKTGIHFSGSCSNSATRCTKPGRRKALQWISA